MKRLSDFKGEESVEVLGDILPALCKILANEKMRELIGKKNVPIAEILQPALKENSKEFIIILARLNEMTVEEYNEKVSLLSLPMDILNLVNDPEIQSLFRSQSQMNQISPASIGSAMGNTEAEEK